MMRSSPESHRTYVHVAWSVATQLSFPTPVYTAFRRVGAVPMDYLWSALGYSGEAGAAQAQEAAPPAGAGEAEQAPEPVQQQLHAQPEDAPPGDAPEEQVDGAAGEADAVRALPV